MNNYYEKYLKYKKKYTEYKEKIGGGNGDKICVVGDIEGYFDYFVSFILFSDAFVLNIDNEEVKNLHLTEKENSFITKDINDNKTTIDRISFENIIKKFSKFTTLDWFKLKEDYTFVFMGDVCDRDIGSIRITNILLHLKETVSKNGEGDRVFWLIGNRDINKLRLLYDLNNNYIENGGNEVSMISEYWKNAAIDELKNEKENYTKNKNNLSKYKYLEKLMSKTYGAGSDISYKDNNFGGYRKSELELLFGTKPNINDMIYISYILSLFNDEIYDNNTSSVFQKRRCKIKQGNDYNINKIKEMMKSYMFDNFDSIEEYINLFVQKKYKINFMYEFLQKGYLVNVIKDTLFLHGGLISQSPAIADPNSTGYLKFHQDGMLHGNQVENDYDISINYKLSVYKKDIDVFKQKTFEANIDVNKIDEFEKLMLEKENLLKGEPTEEMTKSFFDDENKMPKLRKILNELKINQKVKNINDSYWKLIKEYTNNILKSDQLGQIQFCYRQITELSLMTYPSPITGRHLDNDLYPLTLNYLATTYKNNKETEDIKKEIKTKIVNDIFGDLIDKLKDKDESEKYNIKKIILGHTPHGITPTIINEPNNELVTIMIDTSVDNCFPRGNSIYNVIIYSDESDNKIKIRGLINNKWNDKKIKGNGVFDYNTVINMDYDINNTSSRSNASFSKIINLESSDSDFNDILFQTCIDEGDKSGILKSDNKFKKYFIKCKTTGGGKTLYLLLKCNVFNYVYLLVNETDIVKYIENGKK